MPFGDLQMGDWFGSAALLPPAALERVIMAGLQLDAFGVASLVTDALPDALVCCGTGMAPALGWRRCAVGELKYLDLSFDAFGAIAASPSVPLRPFRTSWRLLRRRPSRAVPSGTTLGAGTGEWGSGGGVLLPAAVDEEGCGEAAPVAPAEEAED